VCAICYAELEKENRILRELLAVIHRDGGHHTDEVGVAQSVADAISLIYDCMARREQR